MLKRAALSFPYGKNQTFPLIANEPARQLQEAGKAAEHRLVEGVVNNFYTEKISSELSKM